MIYDFIQKTMTLFDTKKKVAYFKAENDNYFSKPHEQITKTKVQQAVQVAFSLTETKIE